jgi:hypothetical protein
MTRIQSLEERIVTHLVRHFHGPLPDNRVGFAHSRTDYVD